jgi:hypothetical protein
MDVPFQIPVFQHLLWMIQMGEVEFLPLVLVPQQLRDVISEDLCDNDIIMARTVAQISNFRGQCIGVESAGICDDL